MDPDKKNETSIDIDPNELADYVFGEDEDNLDGDEETIETEPENSDTPDPEGGNQDDDEPGESEADDEDEPEASEEPEGGDDEAEVDPLLARARELGLGDFRSVDDFLKSQKELRTKLSRRDDDAALGRLARERGYDPEAEQPSGKSQGQPENQEPERDMEGWNPPVKLDPAWAQYVTPKQDDDGNVVGYDGPPDMVRDFTRYNAYRQQFWNKVMDDPSTLGSVLAPLVAKQLEEKEREWAQRTQADQAKQAAQEFFEANQEFLDQHGDEFFSLLDEGMHPDRAKEYLTLKHTPKKPDVGVPAKEKDLEKARVKKPRRAPENVSPVKVKKKPASKMSYEEILESALETMTEEEKAGMGL